MHRRRGRTGRLSPRMLALAMALGMVAEAAIAAGAREPTRSTSIGIFYQPDAPRTASLWRDGDRGQRLSLRGRVLNTRGEALEGARVELWHADADGGVDESRYRALQVTGRDGSFGIRTVLPGHIELARDNPVFAPRHIHILVVHPEHDPLVTLVFFKGDPRLEGTPYPDLAVALETSRTEVGEVLFGRVELVLRD